MDFSFLTNPEMLAALFTLTIPEIVLGIDNIIFISILAGKLPSQQQGRVRTIGLAAAMITRLLLLFSLSWIMKLTTPLFGLLGHDFSGRDLILLGGGLFLIWKSATEIYEKVEGAGEKERGATKNNAASAAGTIVQIMILDIVFSLDSVITAVGMSNNLMVMSLAVIIAVGVMMLSSGAVSAFITKHPSVKLLALSFLLMIGIVLIGEGMGQHISKGYIYASMAFAFFIEMLNIRMRRKTSRKNDKDDKNDKNSN